MSADTAYEDIYFTSRDGLRLYGRHYRAIVSNGARSIDPLTPGANHDRA